MNHLPLVEPSAGCVQSGTTAMQERERVMRAALGSLSGRDRFSILPQG
jgi:hypothetical protein